MSRSFPNTKPSYQLFTSPRFSPSAYSSNAVNTSASVNPKKSAYFSEVIVTTSRLFRSEKIDSLLTRVIPVMIARSRKGFVLNVELKRTLMKSTISCQYPNT